MTPFVCTVTNPGNTGPLGKPIAPVNCAGNPQKCIRGAKSPMYWKNLEGNNMPEPGGSAPTYSAAYGFSDGPQKDIWENGRVSG